MSTKKRFTRNFLKVLPSVVLLWLLSTTVWQCVKIPTAAPVMPNWNTQLSIPLVDTVYYLKDALKDTNIVNDSTGVYVYKPQPYHYAPVGIGDTSILKLNPPITDTTITKRIGKLRIPPPPPIQYQVALKTIFPFVQTDTTIPGPGSLPAPPVFNDSPTLAFPDTSFDYVKLSGGHISLTITNGLPTSMSATIGLMNKFGGLITNLSLPFINSLDSATTAQSLDGVVLSDSVTASIQFQVSSTTLPAFFQANNSIGVRLVVGDTSSDGNLSISEARLRIPSVEVQPDTTFTQLLIDQLPPTYVQQVLFKGGAISFSVNNLIDVGIDLDLKFKELHRNSDDAIFEFSPTISPLTTTLATISLDQTPGGYQYKSGGPSDDSLRIGLSIRTLELPYLSTVHETDSMSLSIHLQTPFYIQSVTGRLRPTSIPINKRIAFPKNSLGGNFSALAIELPADTLLRLNIWTAAGQPVDFITGFRVRGITLSGTEIGSLALPTTVYPFDTAWRFSPGQANSLGFTGSQLNAFLKNFPGGQPDSLTFEGTALIDPSDVYLNPNTLGTVDDTMSIYTTANFMVPFKVTIDSGAFKDTVRIGSGSGKGTKIDKKLLTSIVSGNFTFITTSTIPVHAGLQAYFLDTSRTLLFAPISIDVYPGANQYHRVTISDTTARLFNNTSKVALKLLMDTQNLMATFDSTQYIRVRMLANVVFNIDLSK